MWQLCAVPVKLLKCPILQKCPLIRGPNCSPNFPDFSDLQKHWCFHWSLRRMDSQSIWKSVRQANKCWCTRGRMWKDNALFDITNCFVLAIKYFLKQVPDLVRDERGVSLTHWNLFLALAAYFKISFCFRVKHTDLVVWKLSIICIYSEISFCKMSSYVTVFWIYSFECFNYLVLFLKIAMKRKINILWWKTIGNTCLFFYFPKI